MEPNRVRLTDDHGQKWRWNEYQGKYQHDDDLETYLWSRDTIAAEFGLTQVEADDRVLDSPAARASLADAEERAQQPARADDPAELQQRFDELEQRISHRTEPSHEDVMRIADAQIERWGEAFEKMAEHDSHGHTTGLEPDGEADAAC